MASKNVNDGVVASISCRRRRRRRWLSLDVVFPVLDRSSVLLLGRQHALPCWLTGVYMVAQLNTGGWRLFSKEQGQKDEGKLRIISSDVC